MVGGWLNALLNLLGLGGGGSALGTPGGTFRRALPTWGRTLERAPSTWSRTWRYDPMALATEGVAVVAAESDDRDYAFDLSRCPEIRAGATITGGRDRGRVRAVDRNRVGARRGVRRDPGR